MYSQVYTAACSVFVFSYVCEGDLLINALLMISILYHFTVALCDLCFCQFIH